MVHGQYSRPLTDAAFARSRVVIKLTVHRFRCVNTACEAITFAEQVAGVTKPHSRFTPLLTSVLTAIGTALAGRAGARLACVLGLLVSRHMAFERVAGNTGARTAGVDGVRAADVEGSGVTAHLNRIRSAFRTGTFRPLPVRERMIPKTGGKVRRLGIPAVTDRVVQAALKLVLEPIFEADFRPCSYGFRPNRRAHDAIAEIHLFGSQGHRWVLDADIEACFDRIDHVALMDRVRARVRDKRVLALVKALLKAGIMTELGERNETTSGTPQGGILSTAGQHRAVGCSTTSPPGNGQPRWRPGGTVNDGAIGACRPGDWSATRTTSSLWSTAPENTLRNFADR